jgi:protein-S-isoprenylcysteine O-methyltransferase Ste14
MRFDYTQVFLLSWILVFWIYHFLSYGRVEGKHERSVKERYGFRDKWTRLFGLAFFGWTALIIIYFFKFSSIDWIWKLSFLDRTAIKIVGMVAMSLAMVLYILFTVSAGRSIQAGTSAGTRPELITTGIYRFCRHPAYLALLLVASGVFLIIPNVITVILLAYTSVVTYGHSLEEERKLLEMYGQEYENYRRRVGRFLPKLR